jgi:spore cortex formation protein SpoVR/YcgB (stage V sporulation)
MISFINNQYAVGFIIRYQHFVYHFKYLKFQKRFDIGRQYL